MKLRLLLALTLNTCYLWGAASSSGDSLFKALSKHDVARVRGLIAGRTNPNALTGVAPAGTRLKNSGKNTTLHLALNRYRNNIGNMSAFNYLDIAKALIPVTDVFIRNQAQASPLHMIAGFSYEIDPIWLDNNPDEKKKRDEKKGIIFYRVQESERSEFSNLAKQIIERAKNILIARDYNDEAINRTLHAYINSQDEFGRTALHWAAIHGYKTPVEYLISIGADVNAQSHDISEDGRTKYPNRGATPLMNAAKKGHLHIMRQLINAGADVNARDTIKGRTPLHWVLRMREGANLKHGNQMSKEIALKAIQMLLEAGANPDIKDQPWINSEGHLVPARSAVEWSRITSPWPEDDNRELNLLIAYSNANSTTNDTPPLIGSASSSSCIPPRINRSTKPATACTSSSQAASFAAAPPKVDRATKPIEPGSLWWQQLTAEDKATLVYYAEQFSLSSFAQSIIEQQMQLHGDAAGIRSIDNAIRAGDPLAVRFRNATGM